LFDPRQFGGDANHRKVGGRYGVGGDCLAIVKVGRSQACGQGIGNNIRHWAVSPN
jgi:hypothetical protein